MTTAEGAAAAQEAFGAAVGATGTERGPAESSSEADAAAQARSKSHLTPLKPIDPDAAAGIAALQTPVSKDKFRESSNRSAHASSIDIMGARQTPAAGESGAAGGGDTSSRSDAGSVAVPTTSHHDANEQNKQDQSVEHSGTGGTAGDDTEAGNGGAIELAPKKPAHKGENSAMFDQGVWAAVDSDGDSADGKGQGKAPQAAKPAG